MINYDLFITQHTRFPLIYNDNATKIYFDIYNNRYGYILLSNFKMKIYGSYCVNGTPFNSLLDDLEKHNIKQPTIIYPRKNIFDYYKPTKFHILWDSFYIVEPITNETFLKNKLKWNMENPYYMVEHTYDVKQIPNIKGKLFSC